VSKEEEYPSNSLKNQARRHRTNTTGHLVRDDPESAGTIAKHVKDPRTKNLPKVRPSVRVKKPGFLQKLTSKMISRDTDGIGDYILWEVLVPAAKTTMQEGLITAIEMLFHGGKSTGRRSRGSHISYGSMYRSSRSRRELNERDGHYAPGYRSRTDDIFFEYGEDADSVLDEMINLLEKYEQITIADYYDLAGISNMIEPTDHGYGWEDLSGTRIIVTRNGYKINLPRYHRLDN